MKTKADEIIEMCGGIEGMKKLCGIKETKTMTPKEIIESMCRIMPYEFRGRLSIEPYLIEAMELFGKYQYDQAIDDAVKNAELLYRMPNNDEYSVEKIPCGINEDSILKLKK